MNFFLQLLLAHLTGDFILQPAAWIRSKELHRIRSFPLYCHAALQGALVLFFTWDTAYLIPALLIFLSHFLIDTLKLYCQGTQSDKKRRWFFIDQFLHLLVLAAVWYVWKDHARSSPYPVPENIFLVIAALLILIQPASVFIRVFISQWTPDIGPDENASLTKAGKYIGIFERLMVFVFVASGHWEAIGFLLTAKSVFRFGELKDARDLKLTEYILVGTLLSFLIALAAGMMYLSGMYSAAG